MVFNGGHSGKDIGKHRGNPIIILGKILSALNSKYNLYLNYIDAGTWVTAIPRNATGVITTDAIDLDIINNLLKRLTIKLKSEYENEDISLSIEEINTQQLAFDSKTSRQVINYISNFPDGELEIDKKYQYPILSTNLGTVWVENEYLLIENSIRSNSNPITTQQLIDKIKNIENLNNLNTIETFDFPGYRQVKDSKFINYLIKKYEQTFKKSPLLKEEHFLLECGWFSKKVPNLEYVSISPNIDNPHSKSEKVSIPSMQNMWKYLKNIIKDLDKNKDYR